MRPVISEEGFRRYLRPYLEKKIPFLAYWHPGGFGLLRLDEVMVPAIPTKDTINRQGSAAKKHPHRVGKRGRRTWEKNMARLRWLGGPLIEVEFDGETVKTGGFEL